MRRCCIGGYNRKVILNIKKGAGELLEITKEAVGIHVLLTRLFFGDDILRRLPPRVSLAKWISAVWQY